MIHHPSFNSMPSRNPNRVALLYPGDFGGPLADLLVRGGVSVVTDLTGRSDATRRRAEAAGVEAAPDLAAALDGAGVILSLTPPQHAPDVARACAALRPEGAIYVDANAIAPATVQAVAARAAAAGMACVDAGVVGPSSLLGRRTSLLLSGPRAEEAAAVLRRALPCRVVGPEVGTASGLKMALALFTKALSALAMEAFSAVDRDGGAPVLADLVADWYPGVWEFLQRNLPTYARHAARRADELAETEAWMRDLGDVGAMTAAARWTIARCADAAPPPADGALEFLTALAEQRPFGGPGE